MTGPDTTRSDRQRQRLTRSRSIFLPTPADLKNPQKWFAYNPSPQPHNGAAFLEN
ncbi:hypothetical protein PCANC_11035 [Puccinia coronata f. sp. avenae]|uniref:Uncharacterized protein n=1 Tax=Puccinia coronata f. sp. avenae TaxID=200324 RepID=A0A2N5UVW3_9BASI|nr:hypothetical protein PCANC_11035 [Puccinia coronata f. sp. avenae]